MTPEDLKALTSRLDHHEDLIHGNRRGYESGLENVVVTQNGLRRDHADMRQDLAGMRIELSANTEVTTEVRDILGAAKGFFRVASKSGEALIWIGKVVGSIAAIAGMIWSAMHFGPKP